MTFRSSEGGDNNSGFITSGNLQVAMGNPQALAQMQRFIGYSGTVYEVHATAQVGTSQREFIAVLLRNGNTVQVVGFHPK